MNEVKNLNEIAASSITSQGWQLENTFSTRISNASQMYDRVVKYASKKSYASDVGIKLNMLENKKMNCEVYVKL